MIPFICVNQFSQPQRCSIYWTETSENKDRYITDLCNSRQEVILYITNVFIQQWKLLHPKQQTGESPLNPLRHNYILPTPWRPELHIILQLRSEQGFIQLEHNCPTFVLNATNNESWYPLTMLSTFVATFEVLWSCTQRSLGCLILPQALTFMV